MSKKAKIIIGILSIVILLLIVVIIILAIQLKGNNPKKPSTNKVVGIYHTDNWNGKDATLVLNDDMTCKYPTNYGSCEWTISDNNITLKVTTDINTSEHKATYTNSGIVLHDRVFTKLD